MTVTYKEYTDDKKRFFEKHDYDYRIHTSPMDEYGVYTKTYCFKDGAQWFEVMSPEYVDFEVMVKMVVIRDKVKMFRTEYWSTEAGSKYYYEKF